MEINTRSPKFINIGIFDQITNELDTGILLVSFGLASYMCSFVIC